MPKFKKGELVQYIDRDGDEPMVFNLVVLSSVKKNGYVFYNLSVQGSNNVAMANVPEQHIYKKY